ncbi:hypothetical protein D3C75_597660 [compost metagenome]
MSCTNFTVNPARMGRIIPSVSSPARASGSISSEEIFLPSWLAPLRANCRRAFRRRIALAASAPYPPASHHVVASSTSEFSDCVETPLRLTKIAAKNGRRTIALTCSLPNSKGSIDGHAVANVLASASSNSCTWITWTPPSISPTGNHVLTGSIPVSRKVARILQFLNSGEARMVLKISWRMRRLPTSTRSIPSM